MSDGTSAGTQLIQPAIAPNANPFSSSSIGQFYKFVPFDNKLFFTANYNSTGNDVWFLSQNNVGVNSIVRKNSTTQLYPNPSNGKELSVNIENDAHYELYDAMGRKIQTGNVLKGKNILSLPNLNNGMYVLLVNDESHKFNVQK